MLGLRFQFLSFCMAALLFAITRAIPIHQNRGLFARQYTSPDGSILNLREEFSDGLQSIERRWIPFQKTPPPPPDRHQLATLPINTAIQGIQHTSAATAHKEISKSLGTISNHQKNYAAKLQKSGKIQEAKAAMDRSAAADNQRAFHDKESGKHTQAAKQPGYDSHSAAALQNKLANVSQVKKLLKASADHAQESERAHTRNQQIQEIKSHLRKADQETNISKIDVHRGNARKLEEKMEASEAWAKANGKQTKTGEKAAEDAHKKSNELFEKALATPSTPWSPPPPPSPQKKGIVAKIKNYLKRKP